MHGSGTGGTVATGGIYYSEDERDDVTGVPGLSSLPLIGWLFRHDARRSSKSELVILITPHVVASNYTACGAIERLNATALGTRSGGRRDSTNWAICT